MSKVFLDTNVLVYSFDQAWPEKQKIAIECLKSSTDKVISTQVLQEFYVVASKKLSIPPPDVKSALMNLKSVETVLIDPDLIYKAVDCSAMNQISFWDGLILCAAAKANCSEVWTEDLNPSQVILGMQVVNPFA